MIIFLFSFFIIKAQLIDTAKIIYNAKLLVMTDYFESEIKPSNFNQKIHEIEFEFLPSNIQEESFIFIKLKTKNIYAYKLYLFYTYVINDTSLFPNREQSGYNNLAFIKWLNYNIPKGQTDTIAFFEKMIGAKNLDKMQCDFILGYWVFFQRFYKLKGFRVNEFVDFFNSFSYIANDIPEKLTDRKIVFNRKKKIHNHLLSLISIQSINMYELYETYYLQDSSLIKRDKCSCYKRDKTISWKY